jgi:hypothetical protein
LESLNKCNIIESINKTIPITKITIFNKGPLLGCVNILGVSKAKSAF